MGTTEIFDHTADVGFRIRGATLDDLFATAAEAMFDYIVANRGEVRDELADQFSLQAESTLDLLAAWLDELLFQSETRHILYGEFTIAVAPDGRSLTATARGEPIDGLRHILDHEVKAVTRHGFMLEPDGNLGWVAEMILDI